MTWIRARSEEQKEERVSEIIAATARLYAKRPFEDISLALIAKEAKFTRSNLYKYFNTREEIFLALLGQDLRDYSRDLIKAVHKDHAYSVKEFAAIWAKILARHERLLRLFSILYTSLERNSSLESLTAFKTTVKEAIEALSELLCGIFPTLTPDKAGEFIHLQGALAIGLYPMTHLSDVQRQAIRAAGFEGEAIDFDVHLRDAVEHLLRGLVG